PARDAEGFDGRSASAGARCWSRAAWPSALADASVDARRRRVGVGGGHCVRAARAVDGAVHVVADSWGATGSYGCRVHDASGDVVGTKDPRAIVPPATVPPLSPSPTLPVPPPPTAGAGAAAEVARAERASTIEARRIADAPRAAVLRQAETAPAPAVTAAVL